MAFDLNTVGAGLAGFVSNAAASNPQIASPVNALLNKNKRFTLSINNQFFHIEIWLHNQIEGTVPFPVTFKMVHSLAIEETLTDWFVKGWIVFENDFEVLERGWPNENIKAPYIFRTDGRNRISIKIYPIPNDTELYGITKNSEGLPKDKWEMSFDCVIYDVEDLPTGSAQKKLRKFYFWDERYQFFSEKNIEWSTSVEGLQLYLNQPIENPHELEDSKRAIPANFALKSLIESAAAKASIGSFNTEQVKIGYMEGNSIDNPNIFLNTFSTVWDGGYDQINYLTGNREDLIFYTSPANSTILDDLEYILAGTISEKGNPVFLRFGRWSEDKSWSLIGLEKYFQDSEKDQVERLILEDGIESTKPYIARAKTDYPINDVNNFISGIASRITQYKFSPMVSLDDQRIQNSPLYQYDFKNSAYTIYATENTAKSVVEKMEEVGKEGLFSLNNSNYGSHVLLNLNKTKQLGMMNNNMFSPRSFTPSTFPRVQMMKDALYLNEAVCFVTNGLTIRSPGRFIFIDSVNSAETNPFDDRFLGQWMMTKVVHLFTKDNYLTEVVANKIDTFSRLWPIEDKIL
jgi:hypothetical protein